MKKIITTSLKLMLLMGLVAFDYYDGKDLVMQTFSGIATYQSSSQVKIELDSTKMPADEIQRIKSQLQKSMQREYTLAFTANESNWKQVESLGGGPAKASSNGMEVIVADGSANSIWYKNLAEKLYIKNQDMMGKPFLIKDSLEAYQWKLSDETKKIGKYNCQKAYYEKIVDSKFFSTGMTEMETRKDTINTEVWFTMEIPVSHGPANLHGLPGLILEANMNGRTYICSKVVLNPSEPVVIEIPNKGKVVTDKEYREISDEKMQEMMKRYKGKGDGNSIEIRIGG